MFQYRIDTTSMSFLQLNNEMLIRLPMQIIQLLFHYSS